MRTEKKQKIRSVVLLLIFVGTFILLQPHISSYFFSLRRNYLFTLFLTEIKTNKFLDARKFIEFREFFSPGSYEFQPNGFSQNKIQSYIKIFDLLQDKKISLYPFLIYSSPKFSSVEFLSNTTKIASITALFQSQKIIYRDSSTIITQQTPNTFIVVFVKPYSVMKETNGFFQYRREHLLLTNGKSWICASVIIND